MSRFFDVLNKAGLNPGGQIEKPADQSPEMLKDADLPVFDAPGKEEGTGVLQAQSLSVTEEAGQEVVKAVSQVTSHVHRNGNSGVRVQLHVDPSVRVWSHAVDHAVLEHYGLLRTQILQKHKDQPFRSLLVTSPGPNQGKTVTALNLALLFAKLPSFKVLILEGDLRRGNLQRSFGLESRPGFCNLLDGTAKLGEVILKSDAMPVDVILRGHSKLAPAELLHSPNLGSYIQTLSEQYDLIFIDSAPVNMVEDTQLLAAHSEAILLVARPFLTSCKELADASHSLMRHRIIGAVFNGANSIAPYQRYRSYY